MRKPAFCICENKDADQLLGNREADQRLCFRYTDSTIPVLHIYEISSLYTSCVVVQPAYCQTWSETPKTGFLTTRLKYNLYIHSEGENDTGTDKQQRTTMELPPRTDQYSINEGRRGLNLF